MFRVFKAAIVGCLLSAGPSYAQEYNWSGLYLMGHFSGDSADLSGRFIDEDNGLTTPSDLSDVLGASYGVSLGNNWQVQDLVLGFEARWSGTSIDSNEKVRLHGIKQTREIEDIITLGPRIGFALSRLHIYATGGLATSGQRILTTSLTPSDGTNATLKDKQERLYGQFIGAGAELALAKNIIVGAQFDRIEFGKTKATWLDTDGDQQLFTGNDQTIDKLSLRFGVKF